MVAATLAKENSKLILSRTSSITDHSDPRIINFIKKFSLMAEVIGGTPKVCKFDMLSQIWMALSGIPEENSVSRLGKLFTDSSWTSAIYSVSDIVFKACGNCPEGIDLVYYWAKFIILREGRAEPIGMVHHLLRLWFFWQKMSLLPEVFKWGDW